MLQLHATTFSLSTLLKKGWWFLNSL